MTIAANFERIMNQIADAAARAGREPADVRLVGVTKTVGRHDVDEAYAAGVRHFGENRVQDARGKFAQPLPPDARLHLIGYLQSNKARDAVNLFQVVHSVDRPEIIAALQRRAERSDRMIDVLVQVNVAGEQQKHGCEPRDAEGLIRQIVELANLRVRGLMSIAPLVDDPEDVRPVFRALRELRDQIAHRLDVELPELSMGMTNDFEIAVEEGATLVRIGRALFS